MNKVITKKEGVRAERASFETIDMTAAGDDDVQSVSSGSTAVPKNIKPEKKEPKEGGRKSSSGGGGGGAAKGEPAEEKIKKTDQIKWIHVHVRQEGTSEEPTTFAPLEWADFVKRFDGNVQLAVGGLHEGKLSASNTTHLCHCYDAHSSLFSLPQYNIIRHHSSAQRSMPPICASGRSQTPPRQEKTRSHFDKDCSLQTV